MITAYPKCRLGIAANGLYSEWTRPVLRSTCPFDTVSTIPMPARRGGAVGKAM